MVSVPSGAVNNLSKSARRALGIGLEHTVLQSAAAIGTVAGGVSARLVKKGGDQKSFNYWQNNENYDATVFDGEKLSYKELTEGTSDRAKIARKDFIKAAKLVYKIKTGETWEKHCADEGISDPNSPEADELALERGISDIRWFNNNIASTMTTMAEMEMRDGITAEHKEAFVYMMDAYNHTETSWNGFFTGAGHTLADPTTYVGIGTLGAGTVAAQAAKKTGIAALRQGLKLSLKQNIKLAMRQGLQSGMEKQLIKQWAIKQGTLRTMKYAAATGAIEGGVTAFAQDWATQKIEISQGRLTEYDWNRGLMSGGTGAVFGGALGGAIPGLSGANHYFSKNGRTFTGNAFNHMFGAERSGGLPGIFRFDLQYKNASGVPPTNNPPTTNGPSFTWVRRLFTDDLAAPERNKYRFGATGTADAQFIMPAAYRSAVHNFLRFNLFAQFKRRTQKKVGTAHFNVTNELFARQFLMPVIKFLDDSMQSAGLVQHFVDLKTRLDAIADEVAAGRMSIEDARNNSHAEIVSFNATHHAEFDAHIKDLNRLRDEMDMKEKVIRNLTNLGDPTSSPPAGTNATFLDDLVNDFVTEHGGDPATLRVELRTLQRKGVARPTMDAINGARREATERILLLENLATDYADSTFAAFDHFRTKGIGQQDVANLMRKEIFKRIQFLGGDTAQRIRNWDGYSKPFGVSEVFQLIGAAFNKNLNTRKGIDTAYEILDTLQRRMREGYSNPAIREVPIADYDPNVPHNGENFFINAKNAIDEFLDGEGTFGKTEAASVASYLKGLYNVGEEQAALFAVKYLLHKAGKGSKNAAKDLEDALDVAVRGNADYGDHWRNFKTAIAKTAANLPHGPDPLAQRDMYQKVAMFFNDLVDGLMYPGKNLVGTPAYNLYIADNFKAAMQWLWKYPIGFDIKKTGVENFKSEWWFKSSADFPDWQKKLFRIKDGEPRTKWKLAAHKTLNPQNWPFWLKAATYRPIIYPWKPFLNLSEAILKQVLTNPWIGAPITYLFALGGILHLGEEAIEYYADGDSTLDLGRRIGMEPSSWMLDKIALAPARFGSNFAEVMPYIVDDLPYMKHHPGSMLGKFIVEELHKDGKDPLGDTYLSYNDLIYVDNLISGGNRDGFTPFGDWSEREWERRFGKEEAAAEATSGTGASTDPAGEVVDYNNLTPELAEALDELVKSENFPTPRDGGAPYDTWKDLYEAQQRGETDARIDPGKLGSSSGTSSIIPGASGGTPSTRSTETTTGSSSYASSSTGAESPSSSSSTSSRSVAVAETPTQAYVPTTSDDDDWGTRRSRDNRSSGSNQRQNGGSSRMDAYRQDVKQTTLSTANTATSFISNLYGNVKDFVSGSEGTQKLLGGAGGAVTSYAIMNALLGDMPGGGILSLIAGVFGYIAGEKGVEHFVIQGDAQYLPDNTDQLADAGYAPEPIIMQYDYGLSSELEDGGTYSGGLSYQKIQSHDGDLPTYMIPSSLIALGNNLSSDNADEDGDGESGSGGYDKRAEFTSNLKTLVPAPKIQEDPMAAAYAALLATQENTHTSELVGQGSTRFIDPEAISGVNGLINNNRHGATGHGFIPSNMASALDVNMETTSHNPADEARSFAIKGGKTIEPLTAPALTKPDHTPETALGTV